MQNNERPSDRDAVDEAAGSAENDPFEGETVILSHDGPTEAVVPAPPVPESGAQPVLPNAFPPPPGADGRSPLWERSVRTSALVHGLLLALLVLIPYRWWAGSPVAPPPEPPRAAGPAPQEIKQETLPDGSPMLAPDRVRQNFARILDEQEKLSPAELEERLRKAAAGLDKVTNAESVSRIGKEFGAWFGTEERAAAPQAVQVKAKAIDFDHNTAQIHDVKRRTDAQGKIRYTAILLDAAGRTLEVPLPPDEGERLFGIFEMIKQNPLLDQVYRQLAMPLLDRLLNERRD